MLMSGKKALNTSLTEKIAAFIVDKRNLILIVYVFAIVFSLFSMNWSEVENDITKYLPEDTETRQGIVAMNENFVSFATARVMVSNITPQTAYTLCDSLSEIEGITMVSFDETAAHYRDASALFDISFQFGANDEITLQAMDSVKQILKGYDSSINSDVGIDMNQMLQDEMGVILIVAVIIIIVVLTLTSRSYAEVPVLLLTFGVAALLNMGTNFICGKISFISNSIAVVLQLALAIDYAIILCH